MSFENDLGAAFAKAIDTLGVPAVFYHAKGGTQTNLPHIGFVSVGKNNDAIINSYGVGAKVFTFKAADLAIAPEKFDGVVVGGESYVIEAAHAIHLNGTIIGYKAYARGK